MSSSDIGQIGLAVTEAQAVFELVADRLGDAEVNALLTEPTACDYNAHDRGL